MNIMRNIKVIKLEIDGMMLTKVSKIIFKFSWDLISLTILMILKALTTVAAVEKLEPVVKKLSMIPMSVPNTTRQSNTFHPE
jgi:hypothetical protein